MALQVSTKFKEMILGSYSFADIFNGGAIYLFDGAQPTRADHEANGVQLGIISSSGRDWSSANTTHGLQFAQSGAFITNAPGQTWEFVAKASGTPRWFRLVGPGADDLGASFSAPRIDGAITDFTASPLGQLLIDTPGDQVAKDAVYRVRSFFYTIPPIG